MRTARFGSPKTATSRSQIPGLIDIGGTAGSPNDRLIGHIQGVRFMGRIDDVTFPKRISYITLGVREMPTLRAFYAELG